jgi:hypothetical protein
MILDGIGCGPGVADTGMTSGLSAGAAAALELAAAPLELGVFMLRFCWALSFLFLLNRHHWHPWT